MRGRSRRASEEGVAARPEPFEGYDRLDAEGVVARLKERGESQEQLTAIDTYERDGSARPGILNMLRYLRIKQPLPPDPELEARMKASRERHPDGATGIMGQLEQMREDNDARRNESAS